MADVTEPVKLLVADIDGTLLDPQKQLTDTVRESVLRVKEAGVLFSLISARPPHAVKFLIDALQVTEPIACFNGALLCTPGYEVLAQILMDEQVTSKVAKVIFDHKLDVWLFRGAEWFVSRPDGPHVEGHVKLLGHQPKLLQPEVELCSKANKIVGVSDDYAEVKRCEADMINACGARVSATRSSDYYLDVTDRNANKGQAVVDLAARMNVPLANVATIGDMPTDSLMFARSGVSIAMGNASDDVKATTKFTTTSNAEDGFAHAMEEFILPRAARKTGAR